MRSFASLGQVESVAIVMHDLLFFGDDAWQANSNLRRFGGDLMQTDSVAICMTWASLGMERRFHCYLHEVRLFVHSPGQTDSVAVGMTCASLRGVLVRHVMTLPA